jgi:hypothetical protein
MEYLQPFHARSGDVRIEGEIGVLSFLTAIDGHPNVSVSMKVHVLELFHTRITRALKERPKPSLPKRRAPPPDHGEI